MSRLSPTKSYSWRGDTVTYGQLANKLEAGLKRPFSRSERTVPVLMAELANDPQNMMRKYRVAFGIGRGMSWDKVGTFNVREGIKVTDVSDWINTNLTSN